MRGLHSVTRAFPYCSGVRAVGRRRPPAAGCACAVGVLSLLCVPLLPAAADAASLGRVRLKPATTEESLADSISFSVLLRGDEPPVDVEVYGFVVPADGDAEPDPISRRRALNDSGDDKLLARVRGIGAGKNGRPDEEDADDDPLQWRAVSHQVEIVYSDLALPEGDIEIGYEIRLVRNGVAVYAQPTDLSRLRVAGGKVKVRPREAPAEEAPAEKARPGVPNAFRPKPPIDIAAKPPVRARARRGWSSLTSEERRTVYYATNRAIDPRSGNRIARYASHALRRDPADVEYGKCMVEFPFWFISDSKGLPAGRLLNWWASSDLAKDFKAKIVEPLKASRISELFREDDVLLYIHGYNNNFRDAVLRTAQLRYELEFPGKAMCFSWPSEGRMLRLRELQNPAAGVKTHYRGDQRRADESEGALAGVLNHLLSDGAPGRKVHIIAHSMGNRVLLSAVNSGGFKGNKKRSLGEVVMVAADVGNVEFTNTIGALGDTADRITFYYSGEDLILKNASRGFNPQAGLRAGTVARMQPGMDTINADHANCRFFYNLGHTYFSSSQALLLDIGGVVTHRAKPRHRRPPLSHRVPPDLRNLGHWEFERRWF